MKIVRSSLHLFRKKHHHVKFIFFLCLIVLSSSSLYLYYVNFTTSEKLLINQTQEQQMILNRAGRQAIGQFFQTVERQIASLATVPDIEEQIPGRTQEVLDEVFQTHLDKTSPLFSLFFVNTQGVVAAVSNQTASRLALGQSFADRDYFIWAKDAAHKGAVYVSDPFISRGQTTIGRPIMVVVSPVYSSAGRFKGAMVGLITFDTFVNTFIKPLSLDHPEFWFVDRDGILLAGGDGDEKILINIIDYAKKNPWQGSEDFVQQFHTLLSRPEDSFHWRYRTTNGLVKDVYGSSIELRIMHKSYWLVISNTKEQILKPLNTPLGVSIIPILAVITTFLIGLVFTLTSRLSLQDGFIDGYTAAKKQFEKK